jgi:hypothetical protein
MSFSACQIGPSVSYCCTYAVYTETTWTMLVKPLVACRMGYLVLLYSNAEEPYSRSPWWQVLLDSQSSSAAVQDSTRAVRIRVTDYKVGLASCLFAASNFDACNSPERRNEMLIEYSFPIRLLFSFLLCCRVVFHVIFAGDWGVDSCTSQD